VREGYVDQKTDDADRRKRLLRLTPQGEELERRLTADQRARMARAYREAGAEAVEGFRSVLAGMIDDDDTVSETLSRGGEGPAARMRRG
jgi:DNA-binding MarR family transcriptional regulator